MYYHTLQHLCSAASYYKNMHNSIKTNKQFLISGSVKVASFLPVGGDPIPSDSIPSCLLMAENTKKKTKNTKKFRKPNNPYPMPHKP